jgi:hypothetical protein
MSSRALHGTGAPGTGASAAHLSNRPPGGVHDSQELAPFRVGGGCPGVFGPNPSAGLDECAGF